MREEVSYRDLSSKGHSLHVGAAGAGHKDAQVLRGTGIKKCKNIEPFIWVYSCDGSETRKGGGKGGREGGRTLNSGMKLVMGSSNPKRPLSTQTRVAAAVIGLD